jgi:hypothetical protein
MTPREKTQSHPPQSHEVSLDDVYSPQAFKERYPHFFCSKNELEYMLRNRRINGLESYGAVIESRSGRRLSIVVPRFTSWWLGESR